MSRLFDLTGRIALVTGGAGTLGSAIATALHDHGAQIVLTGRDGSALDAVAAQLDRAVTFPADLTDDESVERLFASVGETFGRLDILVNNAGTASAARFGAVSGSDFDRVLRLNVTAAYLCAQRAVPLFSGGGKIVNLASIYAAIAPDDRIYESLEMVRASAPYLASKAALVQLTRELAVRLAPLSVQVNCVSPGGIEGAQPDEFKRRYAQRVPLRRLATPEDVVGAVIYFASPASAYTTGQNLVVDGGLTAW